METTTSVKSGTAIYLTEEETKLFFVFRQYQRIWEQVFGEINKNKKIELHFDQYGVMEFAKIDKRYYNN